MGIATHNFKECLTAGYRASKPATGLLTGRTWATFRAPTLRRREVSGRGIRHQGRKESRPQGASRYSEDGRSPVR